MAMAQSSHSTNAVHLVVELLTLLGLKLLRKGSSSGVASGSCREGVLSWGRREVAGTSQSR